MSIENWQDFTTAKSKVWRSTVQVPEQLNLRQRSSEIYLLTTGEPNAGYVYRCWEVTLDPLGKTEEKSGTGNRGNLVRLVQVESLVKGFHEIEEFDGTSAKTWCVINFHGGEANHFEFFSDRASNAEVESWLTSTIGPHKKIEREELGKWAWGQSASVANAFDQKLLAPREPWTIMREQQFSSLFARASMAGKPNSSATKIEELFIGYREWSHIFKPLNSNPFELFAAPSGWYDRKFWSPFSELLDLGVSLFDVWSRDLDSWWLDTWRQSGKTICLAPLRGQLIYFDEPLLSKALDLATNSPQEGIKIDMVSSASQLRSLLLSEASPQALLSQSDVRAMLYSGDFTSPVNYRNFDQVLLAVLHDLDFFNKLQVFLAQRNLALALVPIVGRSIWKPLPSSQF